MTMKFLVLVFVSILLRANCACAVSNETQIFKSIEHGLSFRYLSTWKLVKPQLKSTVVMLYACDGSGATANVSVIASDRSTAKEFDEAYFATMLSMSFKDLKIKKISHKQIYGRDVAFVDYDFVLSLPSRDIDASSLSMATVCEGRRYMLIMNVPRERLADVRSDFDIMVGSFIFLP
jgi:hypothetical protein